MTCADAAQRDGQRRHARAHAAHVGDQHRIRGERLGVLRWVAVERASHLLLPLDHEPDPDRRLSVPGAERADVRDDVRLGVRAAPPEHRAVALAGLERRRRPERLVPCGHDVVVAVEEHGRSARRRRDPARYHRGGIGQRERVELVHAGLLEQLDDEIVGRDQRLARKAGKCDRRNAYESAEIGRQLGHE